MLQLLASLDEKVVTFWNPDWDTLSRVSRPDVQARIPRAAMNSKEVEIGVEPSENGVFLTILIEVGGCWC